MRFDIRQGLELKVDGAPGPGLTDGPEVAEVALCGEDFGRIRPKFHVEVGQTVDQGDTLFVDRLRPEIAFAAPLAGVVDRIDRSSRARFDYIVLKCHAGGVRSFDLSGDPRAVLLKSGLWPALLTRPFGQIPDPDAIAEAILVTAMDSDPLAADPAPLVAAAKPAFHEGLLVLSRLTTGPVYVCQGDGEPLVEATEARIRCAHFRGRHPAGLPGTHLDRLGLAGRTVWQIGYQDVIAVGRLFLDGRLWPERVVAIGGPACSHPRLVRTVQGARLSDLVAASAGAVPFRAISGSVLSGRVSPYLGFRHRQVTLLPDRPVPRRRPARLWQTGARLLALQPTEAFERVMPQDILPVPLMRALAVGDDEAAERLGATDLLEEDVALLSYLCASGNDYGALLRQALTRISGAT